MDEDEDEDQHNRFYYFPDEVIDIIPKTWSTRKAQTTHTQREDGQEELSPFVTGFVVNCKDYNHLC